MYTLNPSFKPQRFLAENWQQQALVIRQAFIDFNDPLDENDLAGMAMEDEVDSRIVRRTNEKWYVNHGPFSDFESVCQGEWTLLVQAVDRYFNDVDKLMEPFSFIPYWRMDDVMVSFAVEGAGVGAHTDQYDVFLIQGKGKRRWRVAPPGNAHTVRPHKDLQQVASFAPTIDVVLSPGDILYIPPGWAHEGVALEDCLTYSIGFRAPTQQDLLQQLADNLAASTVGKADTSLRFGDPSRALQSHPAMVKAEALEALRSLLVDYLQQPESEAALMSMLSQQHLPDAAVDESFDSDAVLDALHQGYSIHRCPGCKPLFCEKQDTALFTFYVNGEKFQLAQSDNTTLLAILAGEPYSITQHLADAGNIALLNLLSILINKGYWELRN